jgi:acyl carrier protein
MDVLEEVKNTIAKHMLLSPDDLSADTNLQDIGVQSIDIVELVFAFEDKFAIELPFNANDGDQSQFATIGRIAEGIRTAMTAPA